MNMKKQILLLASLLSVTMLASCGEDNNTTTSETIVEDWSDELKTKMNDNLSTVIPYFSVPNGESYWYEKGNTFFVTTESGTTINDLKTIEKAFKADPDWSEENAVESLSDQPAFGSYTYNFTVQLSETDTTTYTLVAQYGLYTSDDDYGTVETGALEFAAYLRENIEDLSDEYTSWSTMRSDVISLFASAGYEGLLLPETITSSATDFYTIDERHYYYEQYGQDVVGAPWLVLYLDYGKESEVDGIKTALVDLGYEAVNYTTASGVSGVEYDKDMFVIDVEYMAEEDGYPETIYISIAIDSSL